MATLPVLPEVLRLLSWWASPAVLQGVPLGIPLTDMTLFTNASSMGWGASLGHHRRFGYWTRGQSSQHINVLEMEVVLAALRALLARVRHKVVRLMCDNSTVVTYIQEGRRHQVLQADQVDHPAIEVLRLSRNSTVTS